MPRKPTGSIYERRGAFFLALSLGERKSLKLATCKTRAEAELLKPLIANTALRLKKAGHVDVAIKFFERAVEVDEAALANLLQLIERLLAGEEKIVPPPAPPSRSGWSSNMTVRKFGKLWTDNDLARRYPGRVEELDHKDNIGRLKNHVYPIIYGRMIFEQPSSRCPWPLTRPKTG